MKFIEMLPLNVLYELYEVFGISIDIFKVHENVVSATLTKED